ncbi:MAG: DNA polymerase III subunit delta' [Geminicoccaceae bacterium]|nr:DNA polymerase III subunit delta' [Geminicoccaceae bacterium]
MIAPEGRALCFGHEAAEAVFARAVASGRLPHGWLLHGPPGIGKATLAFRFARLLLSGGDPMAREPHSNVFRMVAGHAHPDLRVLRRRAHPRTGRMQTEITIDPVREVISALHGTAARSATRVLIVDPVDDLNANAANALLKLLEEPQAGVVMLLVCHRPGAVLATIRSRCVRLRLRPLEETVCARLLMELADDVDPQAAARLASLARGSPGRALRLHEAKFLERYARLLDALTPNDEGLDDPAVAQAAFEVAGGMLADGGIELATELFDVLVRRVALSASGRPEPAELVEGERALLGALGAGRPLDRWASLWDKLRPLPAVVEAVNLDPRQTLLLAAQAIVADAPALLDLRG